MYIDRALRKYGEENFTLEIVEDNIPIDCLNERERYWIKFYDSFYTSGKGYNLTLGGSYWNGCGKLSDNDADEIKKLILETDLTWREIATKYNVSVSCIHDISVGKTFFDNKLSYPLRPIQPISIINEDNLKEIIGLLKYSDLTAEQIAEMVNVFPYTVGSINRGKNANCPKDLEYPIRKWEQDYTYNNKVDADTVIKIVRDIIFTNLTLAEIGKNYGLKKNTVSDISRGISWKEITNKFVLPIRKNRKANKEVYELYYGIV